MLVFAMTFICNIRNHRIKKLKGYCEMLEEREKEDVEKIQIFLQREVTKMPL